MILIRSCYCLKIGIHTYRDHLTSTVPVLSLMKYHFELKIGYDWLQELGPGIVSEGGVSVINSG